MTDAGQDPTRSNDEEDLVPRLERVEADPRGQEDITAPAEGHADAPSPVDPPAPTVPTPSLPEPPAGPTAEQPSVGHTFVQGLVRVAILVAVIAAVGFFLSALLPRWWAEQVGNLIDGRISYGSVVGVVVGFLCTLVPLLCAWWAVMARRRTWLVVPLALVALVTALPNLMTLWIVVGNTKATHAGERILDVDGPGFRGGSLAGAIIGAALVVGLAVTASNRSRSHAKRAAARALADRDGISEDPS